MESLATGWLASLSEKGTGWVIAGLLVVALVWLTKRFLDCQEQSRKDAIAMAGALEKASAIIAETNEIQRQRIETDKVTSAVIGQLIRQTELGQAREQLKRGSNARG